MNKAELKQLAELISADILNYQKPYLPLKEASAFIGVLPGTMYKLIQSKEIPFYRPNGKLAVFKRTDLIAWVERNRSASRYEVEELANDYLLKAEV